MNSDPADARAVARKNIGLSHELQVNRGALPHPSRGGTRGYPVWHRIADLERVERGEQADASVVSCWRWMRRLLPFRMTGNTERKTVVGADQYLAVICLSIWPDTHAD